MPNQIMVWVYTILAHVCELDSRLAHQVFVEFLERVLFYILD